MRLLLPLIFLSFLACQPDDRVTPGEILGTWRLTEVYLDPGDGSGDFMPADYDRTLTFYPDSTYHADPPIVSIFDRDGAAGIGHYSPGRATIDPTHGTSNSAYPYTVDGLTLTINYWCFEGCAERYVKVRDGAD